MTTARIGATCGPPGTKGEALKAYEALLALVRDEDVRLEEYARDMIAAEVAHQDDVNKMLRKPGQTEAFAGP